MKKLFLIGKTGQLGSALLEGAPGFGYEVFAPPHQELDVSDTTALNKELNRVSPNIFINTSAFVKVPQAEETPLEAFKLNAVAVGEMSKLCREKKITFVHYSTSYVFDGEAAEPYPEGAVPNPLQTYGISKFAGEKAALNLYPENSFILRTGGLYGGGLRGSGTKRNFVLDVLSEAKEKKVIERSSEQFINPTFAGDLAAATFKLLENNPEPGIYHLVNEGYASWDELAREIVRLADVECEVRPVDRGGRTDEMRRPKFAVLVNIKARAYGVVLPSWQDGLAVYLRSINELKI